MVLDRRYTGNFIAFRDFYVGQAIGQRLGRFWLGDCFSARFLSDLTLLVHTSIAVLEYIMATSPASSAGLFGATQPTWLPSSDLVRSEYQFAFKGTRCRCYRSTAVQRSKPSFVWQCGAKARERVFSDTKLTISPSRNRLEEDIIEATKCRVQWIRADY
jgi:hypothetical protein